MGDHVGSQVAGFLSQADERSGAALDMASLDVVEGLDHARLRRFGRLDFDGMVFDAVKNQEIDFIEARVAIEIEMRLLAVVTQLLSSSMMTKFSKKLPLL